MSEVASDVIASKKRKYFNRNCYRGGKRKWNTNKWRKSNTGGRPGILLTCETGKERICCREAIEILNHYYLDGNGGNNHVDEDYKDARNENLSLEDELMILKSKGGALDESLSSFSEYETSCRGTVFLLCTIPDCNLIPTIQTQYMMSKKSDDKNHKKVMNSDDGITTDVKAEKQKKEVHCEGTQVPPPKKLDDTPTIISSKDILPWDPIKTVRRIMSDIGDDLDKATPRSRFVTRMIPIQATCYASPEELKLTVTELLDNYLPRASKTFAIVIKRRHCNGLDRNTVIQIVGNAVTTLIPNCAVHLDEPNVTIMVEICNKLCGISVIENMKAYRNFNLVEKVEAANDSKVLKKGPVD